MWSELFKRWLEMVSWWFPTSRDETQEKTEGRAVRKPPESPRPAPQAPSASAPSEPAPRPPEPAARKDDLTSIKGIGAATQDKLHDYGIRTFGDLAAADGDALTEKLKAGQMVISRNRVQQWIDAARQRTD